MLSGPRKSVRRYLPAHEHVDESSETFACCMQSARRRRPPFKPAGLESCNTASLRGWEAHNYRYLPYQFKMRRLVINSKTKELYPQKAALREELMGFKRDHTFACMDRAERKASRQAFEELRC